MRRLWRPKSRCVVIGEACDGAEAVNSPGQLSRTFCCWILLCPVIPVWKRLREMSTSSGPHSVRIILLTAAAEKNQIVEALQLGRSRRGMKDSATQFCSRVLTL